MMTHSVLDELVPALIAGAFEEPLWQGFVDRLRAATRADYASLIFRPPAPSRPSLMHIFAGDASPAPVERLYRESLHRHDPMPYHELAEGQVYTLDEFLKPGDPAHEAFRKGLLAPTGIGTLRQMRVQEPGGLNVWISIARRHGEFAPGDGALIEALAPYLRGVLRSFAALERARTAAAVAEEAIRRLDFGWLALDAEGRVVDADAQGERMLGEGQVLRRQAGGRLRARSEAIDREIAGAIAAFGRDARGRPRAIVLSRDPWLDMLLVPARPRAPSASAPPAVIAYVHADRWSSADRCEQLAELFELLPSESRLALMLARGLTIAEAAAELGLTVETARNYSKKIYAKTGARGQPDLVRFIHRSVLAIA